MTSGDSRFEPLSHEEVHELFLAYQKTKDISIRNRIVTAHMPLVRHLAGKFVRRGVEYEDLVQVGSYALIRAAERFDHTQDVKFTTYATPTIIGEIKHYFRDKQWSLRVPRRIKKASVEINSAIPIIMQKIERTPRPIDIAKHLDMTEEEVIEAMEWGQAYQTASLDASLNNDYEDKDISLINVLGVEDLNLLRVEERQVLAEALSNLSTLEKKIIQLRFIDELSQRQVGEELGMSQMKISRLQRKILNNLKTAIFCSEGDLGIHCEQDRGTRIPRGTR